MYDNSFSNNISILNSTTQDHTDTDNLLPHMEMREKQSSLFTEKQNKQYLQVYKQYDNGLDYPYEDMQQTQEKINNKTNKKNHIILPIINTKRSSQVLQQEMVENSKKKLKFFDLLQNQENNDEDNNNYNKKINNQSPQNQITPTRNLRRRSISMNLGNRFQNQKEKQIEKQQMKKQTFAGKRANLFLQNLPQLKDQVDLFQQQQPERPVNKAKGFLGQLKKLKEKKEKKQDLDEDEHIGSGDLENQKRRESSMSNCFLMNIFQAKTKEDQNRHKKNNNINNNQIENDQPIQNSSKKIIVSSRLINSSLNNNINNKKQSIKNIINSKCHLENNISKQENDEKQHRNKNIQRSQKPGQTQNNNKKDHSSQNQNIKKHITTQNPNKIKFFKQWEVFQSEAIWKKRGLTLSKIIFYSLLNKTYSHRLKIFQTLKPDIVNDQATCLTTDKYSFIKKSFIMIINFIPVISPLNYFIIFIDIIIMMQLILQILLITLRIGFYHEDDIIQYKNYQLFQEIKFFGYFSLTLFDSVQVIILLTKILTELNTGIYYQGMITYDRIRIFKKYLRLQFWIDFFSIISLFINIKLLRIVYFLQSRQIKVIISNIDEQFQIQRKFYTLVQLFKLSTLIFIVAHFCACLFLLLTYYSQDNDNWLSSIDVHDKHWSIQYLHSLYFVIISMSTIGYGDISPVTAAEKIFCILITLIACGIFAFAVNMIGQIFQNKAKQEDGYNMNKYIAQQFMEHRNISQQNQMRVLKYLEYHFKLEIKGGNLLKSYSVMNSIPKNIREDVYQEFYSSILRKSNVMKKSFSLIFIQQLSLRMKEVQLSPDEILYKNGYIQEETNNFYYLITGELEVIKELPCPNDNKFVSHIQAGHFINDYEFFTNKVKRDVTIKSKGNSHLTYITKNDFLDLIVRYPLQYENYIELQESYNNEQCNYYSNRNIKCLYCQSLNHEPLYCPIVHFQLDKYKTIAHYNQQMQIQQERSKETQRKRIHKSKNPFIFKIQITQRAKIIRKDILYGETKYIDLDYIFESIDQNDDEQFLTLTPSVRFKKDGDYYVETMEQYFNDLEELEKLDDGTSIYNQSQEGSFSSSSSSSSTSSQSSSRTFSLTSLNQINNKKNSERSVKFNNKIPINSSNKSIKRQTSQKSSASSFAGSILQLADCSPKKIHQNNKEKQQQNSQQKQLETQKSSFPQRNKQQQNSYNRRKSTILMDDLKNRFSMLKNRKSTLQQHSIKQSKTNIKSQPSSPSNSDSSKNSSTSSSSSYLTNSLQDQEKVFQHQQRKSMQNRNFILKTVTRCSQKNQDLQKQLQNIEEEEYCQSTHRGGSCKQQNKNPSILKKQSSYNHTQNSLINNSLKQFIDDPFLNNNNKEKQLATSNKKSKKDFKSKQFFFPDDHYIFLPFSTIPELDLHQAFQNYKPFYNYPKIVQREQLRRKHHLKQKKRDKQITQNIQSQVHSNIKGQMQQNFKISLLNN